jgi:hypothetical protein
MRRELREQINGLRNKKAGKVRETPKVDVWRFRDGRAIELYEYFDTTKLIQLRRSSPIGKLSKSPPDWGSTALFVPFIFALSWLVHRTRCHDGVGLSGRQER